MTVDDRRDVDQDDAPEYEYQPLIADDAVRVLVLEPATETGAPLCCSVYQYIRSEALYSDDYDEEDHYSAASYTWGTAIASLRLAITDPDGLIPPSFMWITATVDSLLRHLRKRRAPVRLWIDALCLNQSNIEEKALQILLMGDIYKAARRVHIWLGDEDVEAARKAFSVLRRVELAQETSLNAEDFTSLERLFQRPWFSRRWIVQEAALTHEAIVHCGPASIPLSWILMALRKLESVMHRSAFVDLGYGAHMLLKSVGTYQTTASDLSLLQLLWDLDESECFDKRDRLAAVYGLASSHLKPSQLHYDGDFTELYWRAATDILNHDDRFGAEMLLHVLEFGPLGTISCGEKGDLPTWVPDWSNRRRGLVRELFGEDVFPLQKYSRPAREGLKLPTFGLRGIMDNTSIIARQTDNGIVEEPRGKIRSVRWLDTDDEDEPKYPLQPLRLRVEQRILKITVATHCTQYCGVVEQVFRFNQKHVRMNCEAHQETLHGHQTGQLKLSWQMKDRINRLGDAIRAFTLVESRPFRRDTELYPRQASGAPRAEDSKERTFALAPLDIAVGDILVPLTNPGTSDRKAVWWEFHVALCLRRNMDDLGTGSSCSQCPESVRLVGLAAHEVQYRPHDYWSSIPLAQPPIFDVL